MIYFVCEVTIMKTLGQRIRNRRLELDLTQDELARKMGYKNKSTIGKIEADVNDITSSKVVEFAHALDTTVAYLMGWEEEEQLTKIAIDKAYLDQLTELWNQMTDEQRQTYLSIGRALIGTENQRTDSTR